MIYPRNVKLDSMLAWQRDMLLEPVRGLRWVIVKLLLVFSTLMAYSTWPACVNKYLLGRCVVYKGLIQSPQKSMKRLFWLWTGLESGYKCKWQDGRESVMGKTEWENHVSCNACSVHGQRAEKTGRYPLSVDIMYYRAQRIKKRNGVLGRGKSWGHNEIKMWFEQ